MRAIAIVGKMGSGKSTVAGILTSKGWVRHSWADPVRQVFSMAYDQITPENYSDIKARTYIVTVSCGVRGKTPHVGVPVERTGRELLQRIGTDALRNAVDNDFWVKAGLNKAAGLLAQGECVVNDDTRFLNEADALRRLGFDIIRITRPGTVSDSHASETEQEQIAADFTIVNDGDLYALYRKVDDLVFGTATVTAEPWGTGDGPVYGQPRHDWDSMGILPEQFASKPMRLVLDTQLVCEDAGRHHTGNHLLTCPDFER